MKCGDWFYKNFIENFSFIGSISQFLYVTIFTSILKITYVLYQEELLFSETTEVLSVMMFFFLALLLIERMDIHLSRNFGIGSFASYTSAIAIIFEVYFLTKLSAFFILLGILFKIKFYKIYHNEV